MTIDAKTKQRWREQIMADYPNLHADMVESLLDVYDKDPDWISEKTKTLKKETKGRLEVKNKLSLEEFERLNAKGLEEVEAIQKWYADQYEKYDHTVNVPPPPCEERAESTCGIEVGPTDENNS